MVAKIKTNVMLAENSISVDVVINDVSAMKTSKNITSVFWAKDVAGNTKITEARPGDKVYLIAMLESGVDDVLMRAAPLLSNGMSDRLDSPSWDSSNNKYSVVSGKAYMAYTIPSLLGGVGTITGSAVCGWVSKSADNLLIR